MRTALRVPCPVASLVIGPCGAKFQKTTIGALKFAVWTIRPRRPRLSKGALHDKAVKLLPPINVIIWRRPQPFLPPPVETSARLVSLVFWPLVARPSVAARFPVIVSNAGTRRRISQRATQSVAIVESLQGIILAT